MTLPDFIGIGAPKAGTSWLFQCLSEHPEVCTPNAKEVHFFDDDVLYSRGLSWYSNLFSHKAPEQICGEFTPVYLASTKVAERIAHDLPHAKLIVILRDPVRRFLSAYTFEVAQGRYEAEAEFNLEAPHIRRNLERGNYADQLESYRSHGLPTERMCILLYEDLEKDPAGTFRHVCTYLGISPNVAVPSISRRVNVSSTNRYRSRFIKRLYSACLKSVNSLPYRTLWLKGLRMAGISGLGKRIEHWNDRGGTKSLSLSQKTLEEIARYYASDTNKLEKILGKPLPWASSASRIR